MESATKRFRYLRRRVQLGDQRQYVGYIFVLQQGWLMPGGSDDWRDVPIIDEDTGEALPAAALFFGQSY